MTLEPRGDQKQFERGLLLSEQDGPAFEIENRSGQGPFVLVCEHASNRIPQALGTLGLDDEALRSHIAWDPGAIEVARHMSALLDAPLVRARFSRLVYDCNRPAWSPEAIPETSEVYRIPGNENLSKDEREARLHEVYGPFHGAVESMVQKALARFRSPALVTVHSFTPLFFGVPRSVELGLLHDSRDARLTDAMLGLACEFVKLDTRRNEPYSPTELAGHTIREHVESPLLHHAMIELRNDLVAKAEAQERIASEVAALLRKAYELVSSSPDDALAAKSAVNA